MVNIKKERIWELHTSQTKETTVGIVNGEIRAIKTSEVPLGGLRVYAEGLVGVHGLQGEAVEEAWQIMISKHGDSGNVLDGVLAKAYPQALEMLALGIEFSKPELPSCSLNEEQENCTFQASCFIEKVELFLKTVREACPHFILSNKVKWVQRQERIISTFELKNSWTDAWLEMEVLFVHRDESAVYSGSFEAKCHEFEPEVLAASLIQLLKAYGRPLEFLEGPYPVIFFDDEYSFMQYFMVHLAGRNWVNGASQLRDDFKGSPLLNVHFGRGSKYFTAPFDACGSVLKGNEIALISKGQVITPYLDVVTAGQQGLTETAATWAAYDGVPGFGYMPLQLKDERNLTLKELLCARGHERAILVLTTGGGEYSREGIFTAPVQLAYLVEKGTLLGRLPSLSVSGKVEDLFGDHYLGVTTEALLPGTGRRGVVVEMDVARL